MSSRGQKRGTKGTRGDPSGGHNGEAATGLRPASYDAARDIKHWKKSVKRAADRVRAGEATRVEGGQVSYKMVDTEPFVKLAMKVMGPVVNPVMRARAALGECLGTALVVLEPLHLACVACGGVFPVGRVQAARGCPACESRAGLLGPDAKSLAELSTKRLRAELKLLTGASPGRAKADVVANLHEALVATTAPPPPES